jgi:O-antigen/teichoic acid export membrane protein
MFANGGGHLGVRSFLSRYRRIAKLLLGNVGAALVSRVLAFLLAVVVARTVSVEDYGLFTFSLGVALVVAQVAALGFPSYSSRYIPTLVVGGEMGKLRGFMRRADLVVGSSALFAVGVVGLGVWLLASDGALRTGFLIGLVLSVPSAINLLRRLQLTGVKKAWLGTLTGEAMAPFFAILVSLVLPLDSVALPLMGWGGGVLVALVLGTMAIRRSLPPDMSDAAPVYETREWVKHAFPLMLGASSKLLVNRMDVLMVAPLASLQQVALYGAAFRITYLITFPQVVAMNVATPYLAESIARNDRERTTRLFALSILFSIATSLPVVLLLVLFPETLLSAVFGADYAVAGPTLAVLAVAQLFNAITLPLSSLMVAGGLGKTFAATTFVTLLLNVAFNFIMIPNYGGLGAAFGSLATLILTVAVQAYLIWKKREVIGLGRLQLS